MKPKFHHINLSTRNVKEMQKFFEYSFFRQ